MREGLPDQSDSLGRGIGAEQMKQFVIIGNSAAGIAAAESIRQNDKSSKITILSDEGYEAYCRCLITYYLAGEVKEGERVEIDFEDGKIKFLAQKDLLKTKNQKEKVLIS